MPSKFCREVLRARFAALILFAGGTMSGVAAPEAGQPNAPVREDRLLIVPKDGGGKLLRAFHARAGTTLRKAYPQLANVQVLEVPRGLDPRKLAVQYRQSGLVTSAELDHWIPAPGLAATPDDPGFTSGDQWHLNNFGQSGGVADADIDAPEAWETMNSATNIIVALVDSGVLQTHEDLAANLWTNPGEIPGNGLDDDNNGYVDDIHGINTVPDGVAPGNPTDVFGHGTHVAGIVGAVGNNGRGVSGVAWRVQIMACRLFRDNNVSGSESDLIDCLDYARAKGAKVINCSFVTPVGSFAVSNAFVAVRNAGIIVVAAAGNSGSNNDLSPQYPASFKIDNIVAVTATTRSDEQVYNYGPTSVHLGAPGSSILSTYYRSDADYGYLSGTSMASPCVAGAVALMRARFPSSTSQQIIARLLGTVDPLPSLAGRCITGGRLNLARALGPADYIRQSVPFSWVPTNGMTELALPDNGVSTGRPLSFPFQFYGQSYQQIFVGANGLAGFASAGLNSAINVDLPNTGTPNGMLCPFWDSLRPSLGGSIWFGEYGMTPNRKAVVSWVDIAHASTQGGQITRFTFQTILHETGEIVFQYLQVDEGRSTLVGGKSATIGIEDPTGGIATKYSYQGSPALVVNNQAMMFVPPLDGVPPPTISGSQGPVPGQFRLQLHGSPGQSYAISASTDLVNWTSLSTNTLPASGLSSFIDTGVSNQQRRYYRAASSP
jgi:subtilisin family serine protease